MWSNIFSHSKLFKCFTSPSILKMFKEGRPHFGKLERTNVLSFFDALYAIYQSSDIKDDKPSLNSHVYWDTL